MSVDTLPGNGLLPAAPPNIEFKYFLALPEKVRVQIYNLALWRPNGVYVMKPRKFVTAYHAWVLQGLRWTYLVS
jgi:hypothetical protein